MKTIPLTRLYFVSLVLILQACATGTSTEPLTRIAFGSCTNEDIEQQMWTEITAQKSELVILLGDNIYGDTHNMKWMREQYDHQKADPAFQQLIKSAPVIGTWDDHDYGQNDGGKFYSKKKESKEEFLRFMDIPLWDPVRNHEGVYSSHTYGPSDGQIKVILLDLRYFRDTTIRSTIPGRRYEPNPDGDVMGEEQWAWFEKELSESGAALHIIGSSIQFISNDHAWEKWGNFPKSRQRMLDLLVKHKDKRVIFLSGDRHIAEISMMKVEGLPYDLYDITSSGLTHTWSGDMQEEEPNQYRQGSLIIKKNFAMLLFNWKAGTPEVKVEIRGRDGKVWEEMVVLRGR